MLYLIQHKLYGSRVLNLRQHKLYGSCVLNLSQHRLHGSYVLNQIKAFRTCGVIRLAYIYRLKHLIYTQRSYGPTHSVNMGVVASSVVNRRVFISSCIYKSYRPFNFLHRWQCIVLYYTQCYVSIYKVLASLNAKLKRITTNKCSQSQQSYQCI